MTSLTKCLPVGFTPHQDTITSMRNDVVNNGCRHKPAVCHALHAQRILAEVCLAYPLPLTAVSTLGGGWAVGVEGLVLVTIAVVCKVRTARVTARSFGFAGHGSPPAMKKALAGLLPQRLVVLSAIIYSITLGNCNQVPRTVSNCQLLMQPIPYDADGSRTIHYIPFL